MTRKLTAIIVDDERLARNALRTLIDEVDEIEIIGEADNITSATTLIAKEKPDVIFLDIQMPGESGFDLLEKIDTPARVIFVTAFDEFALRAFDVNALDYLMKPVSLSRLKTSVERLFEDKGRESVSEKKLQYNDRLFLLFNTHYLFLKVDSLVYISASGDYSEVHLKDGKKGLTNKSMQEWENRLPDTMFCRIHRSTIINLDYVEKIDEWFNNAFKLHLKDVSEPFIMSRRYAAIIKNRMG